MALVYIATRDEGSSKRFKRITHLLLDTETLNIQGYCTPMMQLRDTVNKANTNFRISVRGDIRNPFNYEEKTIKTFKPCKIIEGKVDGVNIPTLIGCRENEVYTVYNVVRLSTEQIDRNRLITGLKSQLINNASWAYLDTVDGHKIRELVVDKVGTDEIIHTEIYCIDEDGNLGNVFGSRVELYNYIRNLQSKPRVEVEAEETIANEHKDMGENNKDEIIENGETKDGAVANEATDNEAADNEATDNEGTEGTGEVSTDDLVSLMNKAEESKVINKNSRDIDKKLEIYDNKLKESQTITMEISDEAYVSVIHGLYPNDRITVPKRILTLLDFRLLKIIDYNPINEESIAIAKIRKTAVGCEYVLVKFYSDSEVYTLQSIGHSDIPERAMQSDIEGFCISYRRWLQRSKYI